MKETVGKIIALLGSRQFFYGVLLFFVLESLWVAFSAVYPMAFDEDFHLGIIRIYAQQWSPFLSGQPPDAIQYGALAADPSYLFHYVMSFPYRLVGLLTDSQTVTVIVLRTLNVGMAAAALILFARVLRRAGASGAFTNTALALFVLVPIVPMVAGQVNYDNAVLLLLAGMCLLTFDAYEALRRRCVPFKTVILLAVVCMVASLVKYAFLPFAAAAVLFVFITALAVFRGRYRLYWPELVYAYRMTAARTKAVLLIALVVSGGLFLQRYALNTVRYYTPVPSCDQVLSVRECVAYGPWSRNYGLSMTKEAFNTSPLAYTWQWVQSLHYRMFFAVNGPSDSYRNYPPLPLPSATAIVLTVSGVTALALYGRRTLRTRPLPLFLLGMSLLYMVILWAEDYSQFLETGQPVAINGRYLLPVLLPLAGVAASVIRPAFRGWKHAKAYGALAVLLFFLQGGGVLTFIARSDPAWYWPNSVVRTVNERSQRLLLPAIREGSKYYF